MFDELGFPCIELPMILEPPCKNCGYWMPILIKKKKGIELELCQSPDQYKDFSCYEPRKSNANN